MMRVLKDKRRYFIVLALLGLILTGQPILSYAQHQAGAIFNNITAGAVLEKTAADDLLHKADLRAFYAQRNDRPFWSGRGRNREKALEVLAVLEDSWTHGLNPGRYHAGEIRELLDVKSPPRDMQLRLDILLTDAMTAYGRDITGFRLRDGAAGQKMKYWRQPLEPEAVLALTAASDSPAQALKSLAPQGRFYNMLREELVRLSRGQNDYEHLLPMKFSGGLFMPGKRHTDVPALRARMGLAHNPDSGPATYYDDSLASAVMKFQKQNNLTADGIIGPKTLSLLNRTTRGQMEQIVANLERLRWLEQKQPERYILVNIPSQTLWAMEDGRIVHEMPVVVGQPTRQTRAFRAEITGIRFNPTWTVPPGIKMKDMLPKLQEDPYSLSDSGIELYRDGQTLDPASIDWANMTRSELMQIKMMQSPGDHNALGNIRVLMPNDYDIYLHDTNHRELFVKEERLLSSGCVRLAEPRKIAQFILAGNEGWSGEKMEQRIASGRLSEVPAEIRMPVFIVYQSIWLDGQGRLVYGPDVYQQDKKLIEALGAAGGYDLPEHEDVASAAAAAPRLAFAANE